MRWNGEIGSFVGKTVRYSLQSTAKFSTFRVKNTPRLVNIAKSVSSSKGKNCKRNYCAPASSSIPKVENIIVFSKISTGTTQPKGKSCYFTSRGKGASTKSKSKAQRRSKNNYWNQLVIDFV